MDGEARGEVDGEARGEVDGEARGEASVRTSKWSGQPSSSCSIASRTTLPSASPASTTSWVAPSTKPVPATRSGYLVRVRVQ